MTRIAWGSAGERRYEAGADRGVLYVDGIGVPWNGLKAVTEAPVGGVAKPFYIDGIKYLNLTDAEEYAATIKAFSAPLEFARCEGTGMIFAGLNVGQQPRKPFGFSYRTMLGNDLEGTGFGYLIHLVYNALASASTRDHSSIGGTTDPLDLSWAVTTTPEKVQGFKPSAHITIDSSTTPDVVMAQIEDILYGTEGADPRLPLPAELVTIFGA